MELAHKALLAGLTDIAGIGDVRAYELYDHVDDPWELLTAPASLADEYHYVDETTLTEIRSLGDAVEGYLSRFEAYKSDGITILCIADDQYPEAVRAGPAPVLLYAKGNVGLLTGDGIGVSGSRETNETGQRWIESVSADLAEAGYTLVSGGARGADTAAHRGALNADGSTIAVLGTGVNVAYPPENRSLFDQIIGTGGLLISMRPPNAEPTRHAFLDRNELIATLSDGVIFVAADGDGGTMAQYEITREQERPVFIPSPDLDIVPDDGMSRIREANTTTSINTASDLLNTFPTGNSEQKDLDEWM